MRVLTILLIFVFTISFIACGGDKENKDAKTEKKVEKVEKKTPEKEVPEKKEVKKDEPEKVDENVVKVGLKAGIEKSVLKANKYLALKFKDKYDKVGEYFKKVIEYGMKNGVTPPFDVVGIYYDDPSKTPPEECCKAAVAITTDKDIKLDKDYEMMNLPDITVAFALYTGPYEKSEPAYNEMMKWIEKNNYTFDKKNQFIIEKYPNDPKTTKPEDLLTEIYIPITEKKAQ